MLLDKRISLLITKSVNPSGSIRTSEISSNVRELTALVKYVSSAVPLVSAPDVWVGSFPDVAVVPAVVTS